MASTRKTPTKTAQIKTAGKKPAQSEILYMAGLVDGKGNIGAYNNEANAFMLMREPEATQLVSVWGGEYREFISAKKGSKLTGWFLSAEEELNLLETVRPHLRGKADRALKIIDQIKAK